MMEQAHNPEQQIAERYFLGELDDAQAEAFEAHYFECATCAQSVVETQMLFDSGREFVRREPAPVPLPVPAPAPVPFPGRWQQWMPLAAAATLAVVVGVQTLTPRSTEPQPFVHSPEPQRVEFSLNRAEVTTGLTFKAGEPIVLEVLAPQETAEGDEVVIRNTETRELIPPSRKLTQEQLEGPFLLLPSALPAGRYEVAIERADGNRRTRISTKPFEVRR